MCICNEKNFHSLPPKNTCPLEQMWFFYNSNIQHIWFLSHRRWHVIIIAVDFDKTLHFPKPGGYGIGTPNTKLIKKLIELKENHNEIILWTCRDGETLDEAVAWCKEQGLEFDAINENLPRIIESHMEKFGSMGRKISADVYIDDRAVSPNEFLMWF